MTAFETFGDFIAMDGHGLYVWMAYGTFAVCMAWLIIQPRTALKRYVKEQSMKLKRETT